MSTQKRETFADVVARAKAEPRRVELVAAGRSRDGSVWGDPAGIAYRLVNDALLPAEALRLASAGAQVVYDACGCGGAECRLDWLSPDEVMTLAEGPPPVLHPTKDGLARLAEWRAEDGSALVEVAVEVTWGARVPG